MRKKKKYKFIVVGIVISFITIFHVSLFTGQGEHSFLGENIEALANHEQNIPDSVRKVCPLAGGYCFFSGGEHTGIHVSED